MKKIFYTVGSFSILIIIWQLARILGDFSEALFPSPLTVARAMKDLIADGTLWVNILASIKRFAIGYSLAMSSGVLLGLLAGWFKPLFSLLNPVLQIIRPVAPVAWLPFIVLLIGIGDAPAIVIIFLAGFIPVLLSTANAVRNIDPTYLKVADNFGFKQSQVLVKIVFPVVFPQIATALRLALGTSWVFLVSGEMMGTQSGLGYMIVDSRNNLRIDNLICAIIIIGIIGFILDLLISRVEKSVLSKRGATERED